MQINTENVELEEGEREYIKYEGRVTLKVVKVTEGTSSNNNPQIKVHFQDKQGNYMIDTFVITPNSLWKIKAFTKALKLPNIVDTNVFPERYVIATIKAKNTQGGGVIYEIKKYEPSKLTNTYEPPQQQHSNFQQQQQYQTPPQQHQQQHQQQTGQQELPPPIDIDEDEIPF